MWHNIWRWGILGTNKTARKEIDWYKKIPLHILRIFIASLA